MSGLESTPAFKERALQIGMEQTFLDALLAAGVNTYGKLAFVCSSRPSSGNDDALFTALKDLTGTVPQSQVMIVRRLWYEAHSHALCDLEARASRTADSSPRELALAERLERLKRQRRDLTGIELDVRTEPGHGLVDRVQAMLDSSQVLHIPPEKCISRQDEINGDKTESKLTFAPDGSIKVTKQASNLKCETSGELKLRQCYLRRALAFDQIGLSSFAEQERWRNKMFQALMDAPPAGYRYTTVQQILAADQKLWQCVAQESRGHLAINVGTPPPLDTFIQQAASNPLVIACLTPLPKPAEAASSNASTGGGWKKPTGKGKDKSKPKGKGKGGKQDGEPSVTLKELLDSLPANCVRANEEGRFICPYYNKGICRFQKRKSCRFGKHVCYFKGCYAERPYIECKH